jgi:hypothetical protein
VKLVTVTHPFHPLCGQQVEVVRIRRGADPIIIIQHSDGFHAGIAMSWTDYATASSSELSPTPPHLLDFDGLCQIAQLIDHIREEDRHPPTDKGDGPCTTTSERYD